MAKSREPAPHDIVRRWKQAARAREVDKTTRDMVGAALLFILERTRPLAEPDGVGGEELRRWRSLARCNGTPMALEALTAMCLNHPAELRGVAEDIYRAPR
jgi:hypothetical protein